MTDPRPTNLPASVAPNVTWQAVVPADVLSGLAAMPLGHMMAIHGRILECEGEGIETFVEWSKAELMAAKRAAASDVGRHTTQAVGHAKRALDSLFNMYLRRDWLDIRMRTRAQFSEKLRMLAQRPGLWVPTHLIPNVIAEPRDVAEHEHVAPTLEDAALAVEAAEAVSIAMRSKSDPSRGHAVYGPLDGGSSSGTWGNHRYFTGFSSTFALTWRGTDGVIRAACGKSSSKDTADCIVCNVAEMTIEEHFDLLQWWDSRYSGSGGFESEGGLRELMTLAHLDHPSFAS